MRHRLPYAALAVLFAVDRSTTTRAVHEIRPLLVVRGFAIPGELGMRLRTMAKVFPHADAWGVELRIAGPEARVRRPRAAKPGQDIATAVVHHIVRRFNKPSVVEPDNEAHVVVAVLCR